METKIAQANENIVKLVNKYVSLVEEKEMAYCPYGECKYSDDEDFTCSKCKSDYWNGVKQVMISEYTV